MNNCKCDICKEDIIYDGHAFEDEANDKWICEDCMSDYWKALRDELTHLRNKLKEEYKRGYNQALDDYDIADEKATKDILRNLEEQ
jgi:transposase-like protein